MLSIKQISKKVWAILGNNEEDVARAFIRFQEYYENKDLKGQRGLTVQEIEQWWDKRRKELDTEDSYYQHWLGFNLPGKIILDLTRLPSFRSDPANYNFEETKLLSILETLSVDQLSDGYLIGLWKDAEEVFDHEVAHAYFATIPAYKIEQLKNISTLPKNIYESIKYQLSEMGYAAEVINDEIQAYFSTYTDSLSDTIDTDIYNSYTFPFVNTFKKFHTNMPS